MVWISCILRCCFLFGMSWRWICGCWWGCVRMSVRRGRLWCLIVLLMVFKYWGLILLFFYVWILRMCVKYWRIWILMRLWKMWRLRVRGRVMGWRWRWIGWIWRSKVVVGLKENSRLGEFELFIKWLKDNSVNLWVGNLCWVVKIDFVFLCGVVWEFGFLCWSFFFDILDLELV